MSIKRSDLKLLLQKKLIKKIENYTSLQYMSKLFIINNVKIIELIIILIEILINEIICLLSQAQ